MQILCSYCGNRRNLGGTCVCGLQYCSGCWNPDTRCNGTYGAQRPCGQLGGITHSSASCFPADTAILAPGGPRRIADARAGDAALAWEGGRLVAARVIALDRYPPAALWAIYLQDRPSPLRTTSHHTVLTPRGWTRVSDLEAGDSLLDASAARPGWLPVRAVQPTTTIEPVFNLRVSGPGTFLADGCVVHSYTELRRLRTWGRRLADRRAAPPPS